MYEIERENYKIINLNEDVYTFLRSFYKKYDFSISKNFVIGNFEYDYQIISYSRNFTKILMEEFPTIEIDVNFESKNFSIKSDLRINFTTKRIIVDLHNLRKKGIVL